MSKSRDIADSAATINYIDNVTSDVQSQLNTLTTAIDNVSVTSGTLTKTFTTGESSTINLTSSVLAPVVSVTKEVPQSGVTNNNWDVNSTTENYTRLNSAPATTLDFVGFDLTNASYASKSFSVASQETNPNGITLNNDGTKMFVLGSTGDDVNEYSLSTAYDISTASYVQNFSVASQETSPNGITFNDDGTIMYIVGAINDTVYQYTLSTGFDLSTASYASKSFSVSSQEAAPQSVQFNTTGTKMYIVGIVNDTVYQYSLSTAWDVSTASYDSVSFSVASQNAEPREIAFNSDGTKMFIVGEIGDTLYQYSLSTGFDISTASYSSISFSVTGQESNPQSACFSSDGSKMYVVGYGSDTIYQYTIPFKLTLGTGSFASADVGKTIEANDGAFVLTATDGSYVETTAPTSYDQVASGSWEMYGVVYNAADGDLELSGVDTTFDITTASFVDSIVGPDTASYGITFNPDGTKMFVAGVVSRSILELGLSTPFDVSTSSLLRSFSVSAQINSVYDVAFNTDGTKMFVLHGQLDRVYEYSLSTGFNVATASYVNLFSVYAQETAVLGFTFSTDGTKMFVSGQASSGSVHEYTLSTAFDITTASFVTSFIVSAQEASPRDVAFNTNGTKMFIIGSNGVHRYELSTGFDISTASFVDSFSVASQDTSPLGLAFDTDGTKMFFVGSANNSIYEYNLTGDVYIPTGYHPVHTTASTDTQYWTDINSMTADQAAGDGNVYYAISTDDRTTWTVIDNTDGERDIVRNNAGTWQYNSNGTYASETWTNATTNTELAALAEAMEGAVIGYDLTNASYDSVSFSVSGQEASPQAIAFNADGTKMFIAGSSGDDVNEYTLSTGFDVSTASFIDSFSVASQDTSPQGLAFNSDGTKMFVVGAANDSVHQYALSTGFDVSTASYSQSFSVTAQETDPRGIAFNTDGTKMFVAGGAGDDINEYTLSTGFDVSTASYSQNFSVATQESSPRAIAFNADGTKMFVCGQNGQDVNEYTLSTGFDVSTASYSQNFSVSSQEDNSRGMVFNADGTKMFIVGSSSDTVYQYTAALYTNQMDKTQLDAVTDPNHIALGNDLDLSIIFNMTSGTTVPSSDGVAINYDANVLNKGAVLGTDYDFDAPAGDKVRVTALTAGNFKVRVV